jgi:hypothetical protein
MFTCHNCHHVANICAYWRPKPLNGLFLPEEAVRSTTNGSKKKGPNGKREANQGAEC